MNESIHLKFNICQFFLTNSIQNHLQKNNGIVDKKKLVL